MSLILVSIESACNFLLLINISNYGRISYRFGDINAYSSKITFLPPHACLTPPNGGTPCNINVIHRGKVLLMGYNSVADIIFIRLAAVPCWLPKSRNHAKFRQNLTLQQFKVSKVIHLGVNRKRIYDFLLVTNSNYRRSFYRFRDIDV